MSWFRHRFFPVLFSSDQYPSGGPCCITVSFILAFIQSSPELGRRLSLVADIAISCSVVVVVLRSRVSLLLQEGPICSGYVSLSLRGCVLASAI